MKRVVIAELLDADSGSSADIAASLSDLRHINQWFGGIATTQAMIAQVARDLGVKSLSLLEVAAGAGYVPQAASVQMASLGVQVRVTLLDRAHSHLKNGSGYGPS